jgi:glyoxylase-like metal-dependent hydrolase (beta-lactamase superfamily II)
MLGSTKLAGRGLSRRGFLYGTGAAALIHGAAMAEDGLRGAAQLAQAPAPQREIIPIAGNLYRFRQNAHFSVFVVTPAGIIATDPIDAAAAGWLKVQFRERFNQTARYLIYSHDHVDHIAGGEVFADTAIVVAHDNCKTAIIGEKRPTAIPGVTFSDGMTIELGGSIVRLDYVGRNHSDNSIVMRFPAQRALFAVDWIPIEAVAFRDLPDSYLDEWLLSLRRVEAMDFDTLLPGHGKVGRREHVAMFRGYLEDLRDAVLQGARAGKTVEQLKQEIKLEKYAGWENYEAYRTLNIEGMYRLVQANRRNNQNVLGGPI